MISGVSYFRRTDLREDFVQPATSRFSWISWTRAKHLETLFRASWPEWLALILASVLSARTDPSGSTVNVRAHVRCKYCILRA